MPIATICPKCQSIFRTPIAILARADGNVQCGECSNIFVGLKHALLLDAPIVERIDTAAIVLLPKKRWFGLVVSMCILISILVTALGLHIGMKESALPLEMTQTLSSFYKVMGINPPVYQGIDSFVLGPSTLRRNEDQSVLLSFSLYNRSDLYVEWPRLKIVLLNDSGQVVYEQIELVNKSVVESLESRSAPHSNPNLTVKIKSANNRGADAYKLEILTR